MITIITKNECYMFNFSSYDKELFFCQEVAKYIKEGANKKIKLILPVKGMCFIYTSRIDSLHWEERRFIEKDGEQIDNLINSLNER